MTTNDARTDASTGRRRFLAGAAASAGAGAAMLGAGLVAAPAAGATPPGATEFPLHLNLLDIFGMSGPTLTPIGTDGVDDWVIKAWATRSGDLVFLTLRILFGDAMTTPGILCIDSAELDASFQPLEPGTDVLSGGGQNFPVGTGFINDDSQAEEYGNPDQPTAWPILGSWVRTDNLGVSSPLMAFLPIRPVNLANGQSFIGMPDVPFEDPIDDGSILFFSGTYLWKGEPPE